MITADDRGLVNHKARHLYVSIIHYLQVHHRGFTIQSNAFETIGALLSQMVIASRERQFVAQPLFRSPYRKDEEDRTVWMRFSLKIHDQSLSSAMRPQYHTYPLNQLGFRKTLPTSPNLPRHRKTLPTSRARNFRRKVRLTQVFCHQVIPSPIQETHLPEERKEMITPFGVPWN